MQLLTIILADSWDTYEMYNGSTNLAPWQSLKDIAGSLLAMGFFIRAFVIFKRVMSEESPEGVLKGVYSLIFGILAVVVITKIL